MTPPDSRSNDDVRDQAVEATAKKERIRAKRVKVPGWRGYRLNDVFIIEKKINGKKYHVSTRATTLKAAMKQLERFEADPGSYKAEGDEPRQALLLTSELIDAFHAWHLPQVTRKWALQMRSRLYDWADHFTNADLRRLNLIEDLKPHLKGATQPHHRAKAIKLLFGWLRQEKGLITRAQDVTLDLSIPVLKAAQVSGESKAVAWEDVQEVAAVLAPHVRDYLVVLCATGWHVEELRRFSVDGLMREPTAADHPNALLVITTIQKNGRRHSTALIHEDHVAAAKRVRNGPRVIDNNRLRKHMLRAAGVVTKKRREKDPEAKAFEPFQLGSIRHSVATWLRQAGVTDDAIAAFLGHESKSTTRKHYIDHQVPALVLPRSALRVVS